MLALIRNNLYHSKFPQFNFPKSISSYTNQLHFTITYLISTCGLSESAAISASQKVNFKTHTRPDRVLNLLKTYGFTKTHISILITKRPALLLSDPEKTLKPKFEYLKEIGIFPKFDIGKALNSGDLLCRSLKNEIIPTFEFLKTLLHSYDDAFFAHRRCVSVLNKSRRESIITNMAVLRDQGVLESKVLLLAKTQPRTLSQNPDRFKEIVDQVVEMGFDPLKHGFVDAVYRFSGMSGSAWEERCEVYRKWGWSDEDILSAFRKQPTIMMLSVRKIDKNMKFLVEKIGWEPLILAKDPFILLYSLEKRIIPRLSVLQILWSKGLLRRKLCLSSVASMVEKQFLDRFVSKYSDQAPELLSVYERKMQYPHSGV